MRRAIRRTLPFALVLALALPGRALAEDAPKLPLDPFDKAETGDFAVYSFKRTGETILDAKEGIVIVRVGKVDADSIHLLVDRTVTELKDKKPTPVIEGPVDVWMSRKGGVKLEDFHRALFNVHGQTKSLLEDLGDVSVSSETRAVCGKDAECKRVASNETGMKSKYASETKKMRTLVLHADVKATAIVWARDEWSGVATRTTEYELVGHGSKGKALWGKTPEEVEKAAHTPRRKSAEVDDKKGKGSTKLPLNPFAGAQEGDFAVYAIKSKATTTDKDMSPAKRGMMDGLMEGLMSRADLLVIRVGLVDGDSVQLTVDRTLTATIGMAEVIGASKKGDALLGPLASMLGLGVGTIEATKTASDEKRTVAGKEAVCKRVMLAGSTGGGVAGAPTRLDATLALLADVRGASFAGAHVTTPSEQFTLETDYALVGHGNKETAAWGKTVDEALKEFKANAAK